MPHPTKTPPPTTPQPSAPADGRRRRGRRLSLPPLSFGAPPRRKIAEFLEQFATLQDAGLPILRSLRVLESQEPCGSMKSLLADLAHRIESGDTLSDALAAHPKSFDRLSINMIRAGETGGVLDVILLRLAEFIDKSQRLKRRIAGAMIYPAAVLAFSGLIILGILIFIVPKFQEIFRDFKTQLPALTTWLIHTADFLAFRHGWLLVLALPFTLYFALKLTYKTAPGRLALDALKLRLPVFGKIASKSAIARFSRTLGTLLAAGVPILDALAITRQTVGNLVFENALAKVHNAIREGEPFAAPLKATRIVPPVVINMIDVGEETGDLDKMLLKIADKHDDQVDTLVASLVSLLEPAMVITLGAIVGTIVTALFLPLAKILTTLNGG